MEASSTKDPAREDAPRLDAPDRIEAVESGDPAFFRAILSAGRLARTIGPSARLWLMGASAAILVQLLAGAYVLIAAGVLLFAWGMIQPAASAYELDLAMEGGEHRRRRIFEFTRWLVVAAAALMAGLLAFAQFLEGKEEKLPLLILSGAGVGVAVAFSMLRFWWRAPYVIAGSLVIVASGSLAIFWESSQLLPASTTLLGLAEEWGRNFVRLLLVFVAADVVVRASRRAPESARTWQETLAAISWTPAGAALLALLLRSPRAVQGSDNAATIVWFVAVLLLIPILTVTGLRTRVMLRCDLRWLRRRWTKETDKAPPMAVFVAAAMLPSLVVCPFAGWGAWTASYATGVLASMIGVARARFVRRSRRPPSRATLGSVSKTPAESSGGAASKGSA